MAKRPKPKNKIPSKKYTKYEIKEGKVLRKKSCPKCGPGNFLGEHKNRFHCGKCGYVEIKK